MNRIMKEATENLERAERDALAASYMSPASREQYLEAQWALQDATRWWREVAKWARLRDAAGGATSAA